MSGENAKVTFGGKDYVVPKVNVGQLRKITKVITSGEADSEIVYEVLGIALKRAEPPVDNIDDLECDDASEIRNGFDTIMEFYGLKKDASPGNGESPAPEAG